ncbi:hypothetical protein [Neobacillus mesonae]|uniref:hypothetical protein n=1 Tax=Neobacillus mesonae TaxID=1193713 RepID=UPI002E1CFAA8|nr:hypothetical protein [Neobacillus mesonae]
MEKENKGILYLHVILATIGAIIIPLTAILNANSNYFETTHILFGASLLLSYIGFFEKKLESIIN